MVIDREGRKKNTAYFVLSDLLAHPGECPVSISDRKSLLYNSLSTSVVSHLFADVPVAIFLSAGIDSSIITALATESGKSAISTLTLGFEEFKGTPNDETLFAKEVALHYSTIHKTIEVPSTDFFNEFERIISAMDQPTIDGVNSYFICKAAKEARIKVTLSGLGGDELFGGYPSFRRVPQFASLMRRMHVPNNIGKCFRALTYPLARMAQLYKYPGMFEYGNNYARLYLLQRSLSMPWEIRPLFDNSFFKQGTAELLSDLDQLHVRSTDIKSDFLKIAFFELNCYMKSQLLRDSDWASMAHSIELRLPFVDIEFVRTVASLDNSGSPTGKRDVALLAKKALPESVLNRKKTGFTIPVEEWASSKARTRRKYKEMNYRHWACRVHDAYLKSVGVDPSPFFRADAVGKWE
jgi:asparagine synthase (glutamine-hydrolysing)